MVPHGKDPAHQHFRVESSGTGVKNPPQNLPPLDLDSHQDRQHNGSLIPDKNGGNKESPHEQDSKENMDVSDRERHHSVSKLDSVSRKRRSGCKISTPSKLKRMASAQNNFQASNPSTGSSFHRLFCFPNNEATRLLHESISRSGFPGSRRNVPQLGGTVPLSVSSILPYRESLKKVETGQGGESYSHRSSMACSNLVSFADRPMHGDSSPIAKMEKPSEKSGGEESQPRNTKSSSLVCLFGHRDRLQRQGFSKRAADLLLNARRPSSSSTYATPWGKWSSWCQRRCLDPY